MANQMPFKVLSIDGGGMRGLYSACVLRSLAKIYSKSSLDIGKGFDLIVGTSTGGIIAAALAHGVPIDTIISLYLKEGPQIFKNPTPPLKVPNRFSKFLPYLKYWPFVKWLWSSRSKSANSAEHLKSVLTDFFGNITIGELWEHRKIALCIPSVNLMKHKAVVFKTGHYLNKKADDQRKLVDVCLAASAAPIILPVGEQPDPLNLSRYDKFVDGGLWANNPILIALTEAVTITPKDQPIEILSIGTCPPPVGKVLPKGIGKEGLGYWKVGIVPLEVSMDSQANGHFETAKFLANAFTSAGRPVKIQRLHQTIPSADQAQHLGLDKSYPDALQVLQDLASIDTREINGKINNKEENYEMLDSIFKSMSALNLEEYKKWQISKTN